MKYISRINGSVVKAKGNDDFSVQDMVYVGTIRLVGEVISVDGDSIEALDAAFTAAKHHQGQPTVIIANTTKGYGSALMENKAGWHHHLPNEEEYRQIVADFAARKEAALNG